MITEPELAGDFEEIETDEIVGGAKPKTRAKKTWVWALGGAVVASAVWGSAFFAYGWGDGKPDLRGYKLRKNSCESIPLKSVGVAIAKSDYAVAGESNLLKDAALERLRCAIPLGPGYSGSDSWVTRYDVEVTVTLHKGFDPGAEFEARRRVTDRGLLLSPDSVSAVENLGEKAYFLINDEGAELHVLDGGAVISMRLSGYQQFEGDPDKLSSESPPMPDVYIYRAAIISDMSDLIPKLKR
ncbi:hypothetical protein [Streptomyces fagopyri]|uniref:hypothetical protein n=1 Tax=Streptomyces fagopyri TaxID=2662397 RepID=UPI003408ABDF